MSKDQIKDPRAEMHLAWESLEDARNILPISPRVAAREAYQAAYHAAQARIASTGQATGTHKGVNLGIGKLYAKAPYRVQAILSELETWKSASDYGRGAAADRLEAEKAIEDAAIFVDTMLKDAGIENQPKSLDPSEIARMNAFKTGLGY